MNFLASPLPRADIVIRDWVVKCWIFDSYQPFLTMETLFGNQTREIFERNTSYTPYELGQRQHPSPFAHSTHHHPSQNQSTLSSPIIFHASITQTPYPFVCIISRATSIGRMCSSKMSCMAFRLVLWQAVIPDQMSNFSLSGSSNKTCGRQGWKIQVRHQDQEKRCFYLDAFIVQQGHFFPTKTQGQKCWNTGDITVTSRWHHGDEEDFCWFWGWCFLSS